MNDQTIIDKIDRPGFAWENLNESEQRNLLGSIRELLAERATQPAQDQQAEEQKAINDMLLYGTGFTVGGKHVPIENVMMFSNPEVTPAPSQDRCCEHDSDCAVHNAPAYPVGPCDCTLSEKPAQDQPPFPETVSLADLEYAQKTPDDWDADYRATWQKSQIAERNKAQWRTHALQLHAILTNTDAVPAPAQDQVAAVRAAPEATERKAPPGWDYEKQGGYLIGYKDCNCVLSQYCDGQCRPIFEYCAPDTTNPHRPTTEHHARIEKAERQAIAEFGTPLQKLGARLAELLDDDQWNGIEPLLLSISAAAPSPQPEPSGSIDTPEFDFSNLWQYDSSGQPVPKGSFFLAAQVRNRFADYMSEIDAWKDAACAELRQRAINSESVGFDKIHTIGLYREELKIAAKRATDAEAKLAAIQQPQAQAPIDEDGEIVAWCAKDGDEWIVYDAKSDTGQHIAMYQKDSHGISVFAIRCNQRTATPSQSDTAPKLDDCWRYGSAKIVNGETREMSFGAPGIPDGDYILLALPVIESPSITFRVAEGEPVSSDSYYPKEGMIVSKSGNFGDGTVKILSPKSDTSGLCG